MIWIDHLFLYSLGWKKAVFLRRTFICCRNTTFVALEICRFSSLSVIPKSDERHGQSLVIHVYEPIEQKLLDELNKQFALFSI